MNLLNLAVGLCVEYEVDEKLSVVHAARSM